MNQGALGFPPGAKAPVIDLGHTLQGWPPSDMFSRNAGTLPLNATTATVRANCIQADLTGSIDAVTISLASTVATTGVWSISVETIDNATGYPTGTLVDPGAIGQFSTVAGDQQRTMVVPFNSPAPVVAGQLYAFAVRFVSGTQTLTLTPPGNQVFAGVWAVSFPYIATFNQTAGTWSRAVQALMAMSCHYTHETKWRTMLRGLAANSFTGVGYSWRSSDNPNEVGNKFRLPFGIRAVGFWTYMNVGYVGQPTQEHTAFLYSNDGQILSSQKFYGSWHTAGAFWHLFSDSVELSPNTFYRCTIRGDNAVASSSASSIVRTLNVAQGINLTTKASGVASTSYDDPHADWVGRDTMLCSRLNGGAFTDRPDEVMTMGVLYDRITIPLSQSGPSMYGS